MARPAGSGALERLLPTPKFHERSDEGSDDTPGRAAEHEESRQSADQAGGRMTEAVQEGGRGATASAASVPLLPLEKAVAQDSGARAEANYTRDAGGSERSVLEQTTGKERAMSGSLPAVPPPTQLLARAAAAFGDAETVAGVQAPCASQSPRRSSMAAGRDVLTSRSSQHAGGADTSPSSRILKQLRTTRETHKPATDGGGGGGIGGKRHQRSGRAHLHVIGEIEGASGFSYQSLFCSWQVVLDPRMWAVAAGTSQGCTHASSPCLSEESQVVWEHPLDLCLVTQSIQKWPALLLKVFHRDSWLGRDSFVSYGLCSLPTTPGVHSVRCATWGVEEPAKSFAQRMYGMFLGVHPTLSDETFITDTEKRFDTGKYLHTVGSGSVHLRLQVLMRDVQQLAHTGGESVYKSLEKLNHAVDKWMRLDSVAAAAMHDLYNDSEGYRLVKERHDERMMEARGTLDSRRNRDQLGDAATMSSSNSPRLGATLQRDNASPDRSPTTTMFRRHSAATSATGRGLYGGTAPAAGAATASPVPGTPARETEMARRDASASALGSSMRHPALRLRGAPPQGLPITEDGSSPGSSSTATSTRVAFADAVPSRLLEPADISAVAGGGGAATFTPQPVPPEPRDRGAGRQGANSTVGTAGSSPVTASDRAAQEGVAASSSGIQDQGASPAMSAARRTAAWGALEPASVPDSIPHTTSAHNSRAGQASTGSPTRSATASAAGAALPTSAVAAAVQHHQQQAAPERQRMSPPAQQRTGSSSSPSHSGGSASPGGAASARLMSRLKRGSVSGAGGSPSGS